MLLARTSLAWTQWITQDRALVFLSVFTQLVLGLVLGHAYDMRIFLATGYLVGSGQNPYIAQDLTAVFQDSSFQGLTSIGYPPPWALVLGALYRAVYAWVPNLMLYNLFIKIPTIAAIIGLAYLVAILLRRFGVNEDKIRNAWAFMLFCPFILYFGPAWGQFDAIVALLALISIVHLDKGNLRGSALILALAIAFKPIAMPVFPVAIIYLLGKSSRYAVHYALWFAGSLLLFCTLPFFLFGWNPTPILRGWNAHFTVAGAMSIMTFFELLEDTYQLPGNWWLLGLAWIPALTAVTVYSLRRGISSFTDLLQKSLGMILVFYLTRTWQSEPNVMLLLPIAVILTSIGALPRLAFHALWVIPIIFTIFNASPPQLLAINYPQAMHSLLDRIEEFRSLRLIIRTVWVIPWQVVGWWVVFTCLHDAKTCADRKTGDRTVKPSIWYGQ